VSLPQESAPTARPKREPILWQLFWFPINLLQAVLVALWTGGGIPLTLIACVVLRRKHLGLTLARRVWAPVILRFGPVRLRVESRARLDPSLTYFFAANHQSWVDIPALFAALPVPLLFLAKRELARIPFLGSYMEAMGMVYVDRAARKESTRTVSQAAQRLREGFSILSFPEGTRSPDGCVRQFKTATFAAALESGVPVVPVALEGPARILPRDGFRVRPGTIRLAIGEPIPTAGLKRDDRAELARRAQEEVERLLAEMRGGRLGE
jgi:1-acyl-sn-glycerol-3-phosphate acyltransferase